MIASLVLVMGISGGAPSQIRDAASQPVAAAGHDPVPASSLAQQAFYRYRYEAWVNTPSRGEVYRGPLEIVARDDADARLQRGPWNTPWSTIAW